MVRIILFLLPQEIKVEARWRRASSMEFGCLKLLALPWQISKKLKELTLFGFGSFQLFGFGTSQLFGFESWSRSEQFTKPYKELHDSQNWSGDQPL